MVSTEPFISRESVRAVLEGMLYHSDETESSLEYLTLVDDFLDKSRIPHTENRRLYVVRSIISSLITSQLTTHRLNFGLPQPIVTETLEAAHRSIQLDAQQQSAELAGWSLIYYRYVRVDLNLTPGSLSEILHVDERTLRRYQVKTIERLRDLLTDHEAQIRLQEKHLHLLSVLPYGKPVGITGRTELVGQVRSLLHASPPAHLFLTGASGVGKTSFIHFLLCQQIEADELDNIVWVSGADSPEYIQHYLQQTLLLDDSGSDLKSYLVSHRVAIVLDDIHELVTDIAALGNLTRMLADAALYVIHTIHIPLTPDFKHIVLPELTKTDVFAITAASRASWASEEDLEDFVEYLWQFAGGNPTVVKLAANNLNNINLRQPIGLGSDFKIQLIANVYASLRRDTSQVLFVMALCPPFELSNVAVVWPLSPLPHDSIAELVSTGLLQGAGEGKYSLSNWAFQYIRHLYTAQPEVRIQIDRLIDELTHCLMQDASVCFLIAEHILLQAWPELSITRRLTWIEMACDAGINHGNYAAWVSILRGQGIETLSLDLPLKYAICLRQVGERSEAETILRGLIERAGYEGEFIWQGRGNLELSVILRQQGLYEKAFMAAKRALSVFERFGDDDSYYQAELELAQIAFDAGNLTDAKTILQHYAPDNVKMLSLLGEIHLTSGNNRDAYQCLTEAIALAQANTAVMGRLLAQMGRIYFDKGDWTTSEAYFLQAVVLLEAHSDQFALARAKTNLAAALLSMRRDYDDVRRLLIDAQNIQIAIRDRHGLMITQRNRNELDRQHTVDEW